MGVTETEAKGKWCPMVRYKSPRFDAVAVNSWIDQDDENRAPEMANCIGSGCMMWREVSRPAAWPIGSPPPVVTGGYCGLAGKP
jgi:hypothetical protein